MQKILQPFKYYTPLISWIDWTAITLPYDSPILAVLATKSLLAYSRLNLRLVFDGAGTDSTILAYIKCGEDLLDPSNIVKVYTINGDVAFSPIGAPVFIQSIVPYRYIQLHIEQATGTTTDSFCSAAVTGIT